MRRAVLGFLRRAHVNRNHPPMSCLSSMACCLKSLDHQEPSQSSIRSEYRSHCVLPLITLAVRTSNWNEARKISFRDCVRLYGLPQSIGLFALLMQSFLPRRIREIRCLIQSIVDYCGNAGSELFELAPLLVSNLGGSMTLLQVYATVIRVFVELSMFEDALLTYIEAKKVGVEPQLCNFLLKSLVKRNQIVYARSLFDDMKNYGPPPNVYSYSVLMSMYTHGDRLCLEEAFELLCEMDLEGVKPNAATYGTYLYGLYRARQVTSAWNFVQMLCQRGYPCNSYCFNAVIHGFCHEGQVYRAIEVFDGMKKGGYVPDVHSYSILVDGLCKQGDLLTGYDILLEMARNGITPTLVSYSSLLHGLCRAGKVEMVLLHYGRSSRTSLREIVQAARINTLRGKQTHSFTFYGKSISFGASSAKGSPAIHAVPTSQPVPPELSLSTYPSASSGKATIPGDMSPPELSTPEEQFFVGERHY